MLLQAILAGTGLGGMGFSGMPGDPRECRRHADNCRRLAKIAPTSLLAAQYLQLASQWLGIADDLAKAEFLVAAFPKTEAA